MKKAIGYIRVSTHKQAMHGVSLEAQEEKIRAYCLLHELELDGVMVDRASAKTIRKRPAMRQLLNHVKSGIVDAVVTCKLDRMFRLTSDAITVIPDFQRLGVSTHIIDFGGISIDTSTPMGMFFLTVMAGFAEMERGLIAERTTSSLRHKRDHRQRYSNEAPYGWCYTDDGALEMDSDEQNAVLKMLAMRSAGVSFSKIGDALAKLGVSPRRARCWSASTIRAICLHDLNQEEC